VRAETEENLVFLLDERIRKISREVLEQQTREQEASGSSVTDSQVRKLSETLRHILAKEFVSIREVALLLNCSDGHVRNLVGKAERGKVACGEQAAGR